MPKPKAIKNMDVAIAQALVEIRMKTNVDTSTLVELIELRALDGVYIAANEPETHKRVIKKIRELCQSGI